MKIGKVWFPESPTFHFATPTCEKRVNTFSYHGTGGFFLFYKVRAHYLVGKRLLVLEASKRRKASIFDGERTERT